MKFFVSKLFLICYLPPGFLNLTFRNETKKKLEQEERKKKEEEDKSKKEAERKEKERKRIEREKEELRKLKQKEAEREERIRQQKEEVSLFSLDKNLRPKLMGSIVNVSGTTEAT